MRGKRWQGKRSGANPWRGARRVIGSVAAVAVLLVPASAALARESTQPTLGAGPDASISKRQATRALQRVTALAAGSSSTPSRELTIALRDLAIAVPSLKGSDRALAEALLARPTDGAGDPQGDGYTAPVADERSSCTANFCVHYVVSTGDAPDLIDVSPANGIPDFVDAVSVAAEASFTVENTTLGWRAPVSDGAAGGDARTDIYLKNIGSDGFFGYAASDPGQGGRAQFAYLVIDNDYSPSEFPAYATPAVPMQVTVAHEYNHVLQFAYDTFQEAWLFESTATWMEEQVFPAINDYVDVFIPDFTKRPSIPLTDPNTNKIYGAAVWHHFLTKKFDASVSRETWAASTKSKPKGFGLGAFEVALKDRGSSVSRQFARFAPATAEWNATSVFPDQYPDVKRAGKLKVGKKKRKTLDHTAYVLYDINVAKIATQAGGNTLKLIVNAKGKARSGLALVGRSGDKTTGQVTTRAKFLNKGGRGSVKLKNFKKFDRITAVAVNADARAKDGGSDITYKRDNVRYDSKLKTS